MSYGPPADTSSEVSLQPQEGWHCSHLFYRFDRAALADYSPEDLQAGRAARRVGELGVHHGQLRQHDLPAAHARVHQDEVVTRE